MSAAIVKEQLTDVAAYVEFLEERVAELTRQVQELRMENMYVTQKYILENTYK